MLLLLFVMLLLQVLVGPGTPRPAHPISPDEVAEFVESAPAGVVLMAVGTTPQAKIVLSATDMIELAKGFALLAPTRVLWALKPHKHLPEGMSMRDLPLSDNIMVTPWIDYNVSSLGYPLSSFLLDVLLTLLDPASRICHIAISGHDSVCTACLRTVASRSTQNV